VDLLIHELRRRGHSVHLFTNAYPGYQDPDANAHRFRAVTTPFSRGYPIAYPPFYRMLGVFRQHEFDLIHTHSPWTLGFVGLRWAESHDLPIVSTYHTLYDRYSHYLPAPRRWVRFKIAKHTNYYYNRVDHVLTPTEASLRWLRRHSVSTPITLAPTGTPAGRILDRSEERKRLGIPPEMRVLLFVGRLAKEKNLEVLFQMAARVFAGDPTLRLWLLGDGPYREACTQMVRRLGIGDRVRFLGFVPREEVDRYYAASDLFVFSSVTETQGLVVQEAMAHGLPAVVVFGGGAGESVQDGVNGLVVRNDAGAFASAVSRIMEDESLYARLSGAASRSIAENSPDLMCDRVISVYREVLERRGAARSSVAAGVSLR
jgi:glycosyltransferase involved in cell wall biosynthesis